MDKQVVDSLALCLKSAKCLPTGTDFKLAKVNSSFRSSQTKASKDLQTLTSSLIDYTKLSSGPLNITDESIVAFDHLKDVLSTLHQDISTAMDALRAPHRQLRQGQALSLPGQLSTLDRPFLPVNSEVDNRRGVFFKPKLKEKPFSSTPYVPSNPPRLPDGSYAHPYGFEIQSLIPSNHWTIKPEEPSLPPSLQNTPLYWISTEEELGELSVKLDDLALRGSCFSVDLEHHNLRSFYGITCLMQISFDNSDYLVDTLALRSVLQQYLLKYFVNPNILKIFFGAKHDLQWLQRDFGIYVVNLFDVHRAAEVLQLQEKSLANILAKFCNVEVNKSFQLADWRIRPLSAQMISYARTDTHYLEYLYQIFLKKLHENSTEINLVLSCFQICCDDLLTFKWENSEFNPHGWMDDDVLGQIPHEKHALMSVLWDWRDNTARIEDESVHQVMTKRHLLELVSKAPTTADDVLNCLRPCTTIVAREAWELARIIKETVEKNEIDDVIDDVADRSGQVKSSKLSPTLSDRTKTPLSPAESQSNLFSECWGASQSKIQVQNNVENVDYEDEESFKFIPVPEFFPEFYDTSASNSILFIQPRQIVAPQDNFDLATMRRRLLTATESELDSDSDDVPESATAEEDDSVSVVEICQESVKLKKKSSTTTNVAIKSRDSDVESDEKSSESQALSDPTAFMKRLGWSNPQTRDKTKLTADPQRLQNQAKDLFQVTRKPHVSHGNQSRDHSRDQNQRGGERRKYHRKNDNDERYARF
ncbi:hypothetical protein RCL1_004116 [Eukaryota sp. TZLM3-RCL]